MKFTKCLLLSVLLVQASAALSAHGASEGTPRAQVETSKALAEQAAKSAREIAAKSDVAPSSSIQVKKSVAEISDDITTSKTNPSASITKSSIDTTYKQAPAGTIDETENLPQDAYHSFFMSTSMILVSEVGDKTFLIAALMAMRSDRFVVFTAAFSSLVIMTILSGIVGHALPTLIPQRATQFLASMLFIVFGFKLLKEGLVMSKDLGVDEELAEVEEEIASTNINNQMNNIEGGIGGNRQASETWYKAIGNNVSNLVGFVLSPTWVQVFVMTFLGEWGDRSQIATIAMAAGSDYWFVILGAIVGHGICTFAATIGGKFLATRISMRNVTLGGAAAFFVFSILYLYDAIYR